MPSIDHIPPLSKRHVAVLVYDGLCHFEFACASEVFGLSRPEMGPDWYTFRTVAAERGSLRATHGLRIVADAPLSGLAQADTIVVPGWKGIDAPVPAALLDALRAAHARGARLLSICSGAVVLAATGLLDGRRATTHWRYAEAFRRRFPAVLLDPDVLYVDDGQMMTSAGSAAGLDLCLHVVRKDFGAAVGNMVARRLVIPPHREGGQAQFVERPMPVRARDGLAAVLDYMQRHCTEGLSVTDLARRAAMSERTFLRRFQEATGDSPGDWLVTARLDRARQLLENSRLSIDQVAQRSGFGTAMTLRHHFRRKLDSSPTQYRARFVEKERS